MTVNPITSDDLTIDLKSLLSLSVGERVAAAASDSGFAQDLMQALTPIQLAKAFPDYYRRELPDISNFILANRYLDKVGAGGFDQRGGGDYGTQQNMYEGEAVLDQTVPRLPGQQSEVEKSKVEQILEKAQIFGTATGETGVTSAIKDEKDFIISTADTSLSPAQRALLDTIAVGDPTRDKDYWESPSYNTKVFGGEFESFADHPRQAKIKGSNAAGRYQFLESTWDGIVKKYNIENPDNPITDFSPVNQDKAALWLATSDYKRRTGRNLNDDLENPPENFGDLLKKGLGGGTYAGLDPNNTTWQAFQKKQSDEIGNAFEANLARNQGYREQEIEAEAKKKEGIDKQITATPELMEQFRGDEAVQKYFAENPEMANKVQEAIIAGRMSVDDVTTIVQKKKTDAIISASLDHKIDVNTLAEGDPRKYYRNNAAIDGDDDIWKYLHPDLIRDKDRILASGKIRTGALLAADAVFRHAEKQGIPMRVALEGGADSHSANHLKNGIGESLDVKPGRRDANGRDVDGGNTWEKYDVNSAEYASVSAAAIQSIGGTARIGVSFNESGIHTQDTGGEGLGIHEQYGGMAWAYGQDLVGTGQGGEFRQKVQSGAFGKELGGYVNSLYPESGKEETAATEQVSVVSTETKVPAYQFGGTPTLQDDEDLTAVGPDGKPRFKFNSGEGLYVKPEANEYADDKIDDLSNRLDKMAENQQKPEVKAMPDTRSPKSDPEWADKVASAYRPSGTQQRAFNRAQFRSEGRHIGDRGSPNIS